MPSVTTARAPPSALRTFQRSEGEPDAVPTVWFCERSLEGESEQNLKRAKAHGGAAANVRRKRIGLPRATTPIGHRAKSAAPPYSAARGSPMRFRRCGSASEAWKAKASRTSRERRPMEGPQRTSGGDALGSPERPRQFTRSAWVPASQRCPELRGSPRSSTSWHRGC